MPNFIWCHSHLVILFEFALCVMSLEHKRPLLRWLKCYVKSSACHVCNLTHFWCAFFFFFSFLQSKRSSTEINTQTTLSPRGCRLQLWDVRAKSVHISTQGPSHSQFDSMKKYYTLKNSTFSKSQSLACKDCWCPSYLSETEPSIIISKWTAVSVYMLNCLNWLQPWFRSELWQLSQPAALNLSTLQITIFLNTSTIQVVVDQGHCKRVDIQYTVLQEFLKQPRSLLSQILKMEGFILPNALSDTPLCYLVVCRKLLQCYL